MKQKMRFKFGDKVHTVEDNDDVKFINYIVLSGETLHCPIGTKNWYEIAFKIKGRKSLLWDCTGHFEEDLKKGWIKE